MQSGGPMRNLLGLSLLVGLVACSSSPAPEEVESERAPMIKSENRAICDDRCYVKEQNCTLTCPVKGFEDCVNGCLYDENVCLASCGLKYPK